MFPVSVRMDEEHVESLEMALAALKAERAVCERWTTLNTYTRHVLAIDDLEEIIQRAQDANRLSDKKTVPVLIGRRKPW